MSTFVQFIRSEETLHLLEKYPNSFLLLSLIAIRARRTDTKILDLKIGDALIGDHKSCGLTQQQYRSAKKHLTNLQLCNFKTTNKGTIATICNTDIYDINITTNQQATNKQLTSNQQATNKQVTTNNKEKKDNKENNKKIYSDEIKNFTATLLNYFDSDYVKKLTKPEKWKLVDVIEKLIRIDKYTKEQIEYAVKFARSDDFWKKNFLSLNKLRKKDKSDVKFIEVFVQNASNTVNIKSKSEFNEQAWKERVRIDQKAKRESYNVALNGKSLSEIIESNKS